MPPSFELGAFGQRLKGGVRCDPKMQDGLHPEVRHHQESQRMLNITGTSAVLHERSTQRAHAHGGASSAPKLSFSRGAQGSQSTRSTQAAPSLQSPIEARFAATRADMPTSADLIDPGKLKDLDPKDYVLLKLTATKPSREQIRENGLRSLSELARQPQRSQDVDWRHDQAMSAKGFSEDPDVISLTPYLTQADGQVDEDTHFVAVRAGPWNVRNSVERTRGNEESYTKHACSLNDFADRRAALPPGKSLSADLKEWRSAGADRAPYTPEVCIRTKHIEPKYLLDTATARTCAAAVAQHHEGRIASHPNT